MNLKNKIITEIKSGNHEVIMDVYKKYRNDFIRWAVAHFNVTVEESKDIFQDVLITFYQNVSSGVVGSKEYRVFGTLRCRTFGINAVEELALTNTEFVSKVDQIFLRFEESLPVLQAVTITG